MMAVSKTSPLAKAIRTVGNPVVAGEAGPGASLSRWPRTTGSCLVCQVYNGGFFPIIGIFFLLS
jgi:hypothetical protein